MGMNIKNTNFLTNEQIREVAPTVFTTSPSNEVSKHYTHIPTSNVIEDMRTLGWGVVDAKQVNARKNTTRGFQKHLVVFRNPDVIINGDDGDTVYPQILLTNSHDGKNAFAFTAGLFRMICENGLVISTQQFENVKMRHMGYSFEELQEMIRGMVERLPLTVESMNVMKEIELAQEQALEFAKEALEVRFGDDIQNIEVNLEELLTPTRKQDEGSDLWSRFNVVQEKIIHGDFNYVVGTKNRKARKIKNFQQDQKINQELFDLALEYCN